MIEEERYFYVSFISILFTIMFFSVPKKTNLFQDIDTSSDMDPVMAGVVGGACVLGLVFIVSVIIIVVVVCKKRNGKKLYVKVYVKALI